MKPATDRAFVSEARKLIRSLDRATMANALPARIAAPDDPPGAAWPYASLVLVAVDHDLSPVLLISNLAEHTRAIAADGHVSLLFDGTHGLPQPLTGPRLTVLGRAAKTTDPRLRARFLARHPDASLYADFGDFNFYRLEIARAHLVAGFGRIAWIDGAELAGGPPPAALVEQEAGIVEHMNADHADAVQLYAAQLLGRAGTGWRMTGIDPQGVDLRLGGDIGRVEFPESVHNAEEARVMLIRLLKDARAGKILS